MAITKRLKFQEIYEFCRMNWAFDPPRVATHYSLLTKRSEFLWRDGLLFCLDTESRDEC